MSDLSPSQPDRSFEPPLDVPASADGPTRSVQRNMGALLASQAVTWALTTAVLWIVPRYVGDVGLGQMGIARSFWGMATVIAGFGTSVLLAAEVAQRRTTVTSLTRAVIKLRVALFALAAPVVVLVMLVGPYDTATFQIVMVFGVVHFFGLILEVQHKSLHGLQEMGETSRIVVIRKLVTVAGTVGVLLLGGRVIGLAILESVVAAGALILSVRALRRKTPATAEPTDLVGKKLIAASVVFLFAGAARVIYQQIDTVVMSLLIGERPVGWYNAADIVFGSMLFVPVIMMTALFPKIAESHKRNPERTVGLLQQTFGSMLLVSVPIGLTVFVISGSFVDLVFGSKFEQSGDVLALFGFVVIPTCQTILLGQFALATGRAKVWTALMFGAITVSIVLDILLVPFFDDRYENAAIAGSAAYLITETLLMIVGVGFLARAVLRRALTVRVIKCGVAGAAMVAASWPFRDQFFLVSASVAAAVYLVVVLVLRTLNHEERRAFQQALRPVAQRLGRVSS